MELIPSSATGFQFNLWYVIYNTTSDTSSRKETLHADIPTDTTYPPYY